MIIRRRQFLATLGLAALLIGTRADDHRPLHVAATNQRIPSAFLAIDPARTGFKFRTMHVLGAPATELVLGFCGWAIPKNVEVDVPAPHSYHKMAVELGGRCVPVTFGGARSITIVGGQPFVLSDPIPAAAFGLSAFARDTLFYVRALGVASPGSTLPAGTLTAVTGSRMSSFAVGTGLDDIDRPGTLSSPVGATTRTTAPGPCLVLGRFPAGYPAVVCAGDSIADGVGDLARLVAGNGFFNRAAVDADGRNAIGSLNLTKRGSTAGTASLGLGVPGAPGFAYRQAMLGFGNILVEQYGTNTLGTGRAIPASAVIEPSRAIWALARAAGVQRVLRATLLPRTTSSDAFIGAAGQRPAANWDAGQARDAVNAAFAAAADTGEIDAVVDLLGAVADPGSAHRWMSNGSANFATPDGLHPSSEASRRMAPVLRAAYDRLMLS